MVFIDQQKVYGMKVSDAKQKVCPFINDGVFQFASSFGIGSTDQMPQNIKCICGDCMAWVYTDEYRLVDELCISFTDGELDRKSYEIAQQITPAHHKIEKNAPFYPNEKTKYETWARKIEIADHEKSGYCARIGQR